MTDLENEYLKIATMTNKEAAEVLKNIQILAMAGRGCGKTKMQLTYHTAITKAIKCLEENPDTVTELQELEFRRKATYESEIKEKNQQRDFRAGTTIHDEDSCYPKSYLSSDFSNFMNPPVIGVDLATESFNRDNLIFPEEMEKERKGEGI